MGLTIEQIVSDESNAGKLFKVIDDSGYVYILTSSFSDMGSEAKHTCKAVYIKPDKNGGYIMRAYAAGSKLDRGLANLQLEESNHLELVISLKRN